MDLADTVDNALDDRFNGWMLFEPKTTSQHPVEEPTRDEMNQCLGEAILKKLVRNSILTMSKDEVVDMVEAKFPGAMLYED